MFVTLFAIGKLRRSLCLRALLTQSGHVHAQTDCNTPDDGSRGTCLSEAAVIATTRTGFPRNVAARKSTGFYATASHLSPSSNLATTLVTREVSIPPGVTLAPSCHFTIHRLVVCTDQVWVEWAKFYGRYSFRSQINFLYTSTVFLAQIFWNCFPLSPEKYKFFFFFFTFS